MRYPKDTYPLIADYDADDYDYQTHWKNRAYEQWAESSVLKRLLICMGRPQWLIDFGGGFGRNVRHYFPRAEHAVLVDYSLGNLTHAASVYAEEIERGRLFLIRADLYRLPFLEGAFDMGFMVRVLHHLTQVDDALGEMGRVVSQKWLLDVPIKHHALARLRAWVRRERRQLSSWEPRQVGTGETPFASFHLAKITQLLAEDGWNSSIVASVNNFRRWDQRLPAWVIALLSPAIYGLEMLAQRVGRGWWGPSQFIWATRREPCPAQGRADVQPTALRGTPWAALAMKMRCPICHLPLQWSDNAAYCEPCSCVYPRTGLIWNFVPVKNAAIREGEMAQSFSALP
jgi:SAM-dependent methyltransferase